MARHKRHSRSRSFTVPVAVVGGFIPLVNGMWVRRASLAEVGRFTSAALTGYFPGAGFQPSYMKDGALPIVAGIIAHKVANMLGINRMLARARVPILRI